MSFFSDLKNTDLVTFVGKSGISVLSKALESVFAETDLAASDLSKSLHLKSRCLMAWLQEMQKSSSLSRIPLTSIIKDNSVQDYTISFSNDNVTIHKREFNKFNKNIELVFEGKRDNLPEIASKILVLTPFEDELENTEFKKSADLDNMVSTLVQKHIEFLKTSQQLRLHKGEEKATCPDCKEEILITDKGANLCICYSFMKNNSIHVIKNDIGGLTLHFGKSWNKENIALFSQALKNKLK